MTREEKIALKEEIISVCKAKLEERIAAAEKAMLAAQESANSEEKSSAGDKYETSRAMGHRDRDMSARQMMEAKKELTILNNIKAEQELLLASTGAVIISDKDTYFLGVGLGKVSARNLNFIAVSAASPIGQALKGKKKGDKLSFNQLNFKIQDIF